MYPKTPMVGRHLEPPALPVLLTALRSVSVTLGHYGMAAQALQRRLKAAKERSKERKAGRKFATAPHPHSDGEGGTFGYGRLKIGLFGVGLKHAIEHAALKRASWRFHCRFSISNRLKWVLREAFP